MVAPASVITVLRGYGKSCDLSSAMSIVRRGSILSAGACGEQPDPGKVTAGLQPGGRHDEKRLYTYDACRDHRWVDRCDVAGSDAAKRSSHCSRSAGNHCRNG